MQLSRPPNGFRMIIPQTVSNLIESKTDRFPRLSQHWNDVIERLKFVAHREGEPIPQQPAHYIFIAKEDLDAGVPRIRLVYKILGDTLTVKIAYISEEIG